MDTNDPVKDLEQADLIVTGRRDFADLKTSVLDAETLDEETKDRLAMRMVYALAPNLVAVTGLIDETIRVLNKVRPYFDEGTVEEISISNLIKKYKEVPKESE